MSIEDDFKVLHDIFEEHAVSSSCREALLKVLRVAERSDTGHEVVISPTAEVKSRACEPGIWGAHRPDCELGAMLRAIGGAEEVQRQADDAHCLALDEAAIRSRFPRSPKLAVEVMDGEEMARLTTEYLERVGKRFA